MGDNPVVQFRSDGLGLSPAEYARLLAEIAEPRGIDIDDYSRGGVVAELEERMAALLGKEAAVFLPTGTLANHLAVRRLTTGRGRRVLVQQESHLWNDEGDCATHLSGLTLVPLAPGRATITLAEIEQAVAGAPEMRVAVPVGAISIETPVRRVAGEAFDPAELRAISAFARERGIGLHLDGARLLIEAAYTGIAPADTAALFDTVYVSLWKYLNAASGAILAGPRALLDGLYHERRMFGGSLPHAWPYAAVALHFLDGFAERFAEAAALSGAAAGRACRASPGDGRAPGGGHQCQRSSGSPEPARRPCRNIFPPAASRSARRGAFGTAAPNSRCTRTRRSCAGRSPISSTLSPPRSTRSHD